MTIIALPVALLFLILAGCGTKKDSTGKLVSPMNGDRVIGEYLVSLRPGVSPDLIRQVYKQYGVQSLKKIGSDLYLIKLETDPGVKEIQALITEQMRYVEPNQIYRAMPHHNK